MGVALALAATAGLVAAGVNAWWLMPPAVLLVLAVSLAPCDALGLTGSPVYIAAGAVTRPECSP